MPPIPVTPEPAPVIPDIGESVSFNNVLCPQLASSSGVEEATQLVIQDEANFLHHLEISDLFFDDETPAVNFETETVVAVNMGIQSTYGISRIEITEIVEFNDKISVAVLSVTPVSDCPANQAISFPYCMVSIPKSEKDVVFDITQTEVCPE